jgi:glycolate oxidase iron-sulfur subunit
MACVSSCPSGVRYDRLIESTRAAVEDEVDASVGRPPRPRALFRLLPYPGACARRSRSRRSAARADAEAVPAARRHRAALARARRRADRDARCGPPRGRVGLLTGCVQSACFPT